jgi:acetyltransferase-like isoleucine patch superfamily enzyme
MIGVNLKMNINYLAKKIMGRATCTKANSTTLTSRAKIINLQSQDDKISIGEETVVEGELLVFRHGGTIRIGAWCYVGVGTRIWSSCSIYIGDRVLMAHNINIIDSQTHPISPKLRHEHCKALFSGMPPESISLGERPIYIDDDAWVGAGATILRGVRIEKGAIVSAGAVVTKNVAAYCIVAGNPALVIRYLTDNEICGGYKNDAPPHDLNIR